MSKATCPACDTEYGATALSCPHCLRLVHGEELKVLANSAASARAASDSAAERQAWRRAMSLLPAETRQRMTIERRLAELEDEPASKVATKSSGAPAWAKGWGALGAIALILWKMKGLILLGFGKLKFLTMGLSKASTFFSFLASFALYWSVWGWRFALGFLVAMYVHEMGHVAALRRFGIPASAPMFVPGLGAFVRMKQHPATVGEDARIGLAGPEWGLGAALAAYFGFWMTGAPIWAAIGYSAAFLNLFNLLPVWQLDGGRGFAALTRSQRAAVAIGFAVAWALTQQGILGLICVVSFYRAFTAERAIKGDSEVLARFLWLIAAFSAMLLLGRPTL